MLLFKVYGPDEEASFLMKNASYYIENVGMYEYFHGTGLSFQCLNWLIMIDIHGQKVDNLVYL